MFPSEIWERVMQHCEPREKDSLYNTSHLFRGLRFDITLREALKIDSVSLARHCHWEHELAAFTAITLKAYKSIIHVFSQKEPRLVFSCLIELERFDVAFACFGRELPNNTYYSCSSKCAEYVYQIYLEAPESDAHRQKILEALEHASERDYTNIWYAQLLRWCHAKDLFEVAKTICERLPDRWNDIVASLRRNFYVEPEFLQRLLSSHKH
jgi:hypothetical protein